MAVQYTEDDRKYLEFIQNIIARMNQCSFKLKQWVVILVGSIFSLTVFSIKFIPIAFLPIVIFCLLDAYYLHQERKYRVLYNKKVPVYDLSASHYLRGFCEYVKIIFSISILPFYFPLFILVVLGWHYASP